MTEEQERPTVGDDAKHLLDLFEYEHLPVHLVAVSRPFHDLAWAFLTPNNGPALEQGPEMLAGLRKLLEAKDCIVRQAVIDSRAAVAQTLKTNPAVPYVVYRDDDPRQRRTVEESLDRCQSQHSFDDIIGTAHCHRRSGHEGVHTDAVMQWL